MGIQWLKMIENEMFEVKFINSKKGRGLFATRLIEKGEVIDKAHVIIISRKESDKLYHTKIFKYLFVWKFPKSKSDKYYDALALGPCELINHDGSNPNARFYCLKKEKLIVFDALRDILPGEEITIKYRDDADKMWFEK
jgi:SET domain-containing protein